MKRMRLASLLMGAFIILTPQISHGMHIMEGFLPLGHALFWTAVSAPFFLVGIRKLKTLEKEDSNIKLLLGLAGGFLFVLSALKIPSVTGSCSHPTGVGLSAILFGPYITTVIGTLVLIFQAVLLAHGGITTLGANMFSMAIAGPMISYGIFMSLRSWGVKKSTTVFLAASIGNISTYIITSIQLALAFPDGTGGFIGSLAKFLSIFAVTQVPLAIVEGLLTALVYGMIMEYKEEGVVRFEALEK